MATSDDIKRYIRCNMLVVQVLTPLVREYMELSKVPPATVYNLIMQPKCSKFRATLSQPQMTAIQTLQSDGYKTFDITLMYKLAREKRLGLIITEHPTREWGSAPLQHELTIGDDIERIRLCRDKIMHIPNHIVPERELNDLFDKFIEVGKRADTHLNLTDELSYEQQIQDLRNSPIDPETTRKLNETLMENESLKEIVQLHRFKVYVDKDIENYIEDIRRGKEPLDDQKHIRMVINGLSNTAKIAEIINSCREKIKLACKDCLIELDEASEGSLILYLEVQNRIFQSDDLFHVEMDRFIEILFQVISFKPEISIFSYLLILQDERYPGDSSSEEEDDNPPEEIVRKKLLFDLTVHNKAFQTDESLRQNLNRFVEAVITDINGQEIKKDNSVSAVLKLHESEYVRTSQQILVCGLCEEDKSIKVKCIDCDLFLCQRCLNKTHAKFMNASLHDVVPIEDVHSHDKKGNIEKNFTPVKCEKHSTKLCCMYCVTCGQLVCDFCIDEIHKTHNKEDISTFCHNRVKKMKKNYSQTHYEVEGITSRLLTMREVQTNNYSTMGNLLLKEKENAINQINTAYEELFIRYNENKKKCLELMCLKETEFLKCGESAHQILKDVENLFETKDTNEFLGASGKFETFLRNHPSKLLINGYEAHVEHFFKKQFHFKICSEMLQTEIKVKSKGVFKCPMSVVNTITSDQDGNIWIADKKRNIKQLKMRESVNILKSKQIDVAIEEIRCLQNNQILFTSSTKIMQLTNDEVNELIDLDPYEPSTIHVLNEHEIIVGFYHYKIDDTIDKPVIFRLEMNGKIKQIYKNYESQLLQKELIRSCTTFANGNITYIDSCLMKHDGCVVNIDNNGVVQWKYNGNQVLNVKNHPFNPMEILTTRYNNLLISDRHEGAFHILTPLGSLITIVDITHIGLPSPNIMTIDICDTLWVLSNSKNQNTLCAIEYSGF